MFSFSKTNIFINVVVMFFIYIFLKPDTSVSSRFTIKNPNYHTHCVKRGEQVKVGDDDTLVDLERTDDATTHSHPNLYGASGYVAGHSHTKEDLFPHDTTIRPQPVIHYDSDNLYTTKYDRSLEHVLKGLVVVVVLISAVVLNRVFKR